MLHFQASLREVFLSRNLFVTFDLVAFLKAYPQVTLLDLSQNEIETLGKSSTVFTNTNLQK